MGWKGFRDTQATIIIDVTQSEEEILKQADKSKHKNVNRAIKEGLVYVEAKEEEWNDWYAIHCKVWRDGGLNPHTSEELKKPNYKLYLVKKDNLLLGGGVFEVLEDRIVFIAFAALIEYQNLRVNDFLYWNSILWAKNNAKKYVDLGGWQIKARGHLTGVNVFKEKWGGKLTTYYVYSKNPFYILGRKLIKNSGMFRWIWDRIQLRPLKEREKKDDNKV